MDKMMGLRRPHVSMAPRPLVLALMAVAASVLVIISMTANSKSPQTNLHLAMGPRTTLVSTRANIPVGQGRRRFVPKQFSGEVQMHASPRREVSARGFFDGILNAIGASAKPRYISPMEFYNLKTKTLEGQEFSFEKLKGKTVLITNVASK
mmetsp:Transcript_17550/g.24550  ORF Transcript_17550/g.24550 Transcript_17550/m.24550 type:complete len:151 (-) Transcript_17550:1114-1566(-)